MIKINKLRLFYRSKWTKYSLIFAYKH